MSEVATRVYDAGITKLSRSTKVQLRDRRASLIEIARSARPATVRHIYYRAVVANLVPKSQNGYQKVQRDLVELRRSGEIPYGWIEDTGRRAHHPRVWYMPETALEVLARTYRRNPWQEIEAPCVEIWCESRSIAGTLISMKDTYAVPIFPIGGQTSDSFVYEAAQAYREGETVVVLYAGDYDPAGLEVASQLEGKLRHHAADEVMVDFRKLAITDEMAAAFQSLGTPPKKSTWKDFHGDRHEFTGQSIELEAVDPVLLRGMFADAIEGVATEHYGFDIFEQNKMIEAGERDWLRSLAEANGGGVDE